MSEFSITPNFWINLFIAIITTGTFAAAGITAYVNRELNIRQQRIETASLKMTVISKCAPDYLHLATSSNALRSVLAQNTIDFPSFFYHLCNFLYIYNKIYTSYGGIQLDTIIAEKTITKILNDIFVTMVREMSYSDMHEMRLLCNDNPNYYSFSKDVLRGNPEIYRKVRNWLIYSFSRTMLMQRFLWFSQLLELELNNVYWLWYDDEPYKMGLDQNLRNYLLETSPDYLNRIKPSKIAKFYRLLKGKKFAMEVI